MSKRIVFTVMMICALMLAGRAGAEDASGAELAKARFPRLTQGINVGWLNNGKFTLNREAAQREAELIKKVGCRHVRLYLNVDGLRDVADRAKPDAKKIPTLLEAIELALGQDLAVIVDTFHYSNAGLIKFPTLQDPEAEVIVKFWGALAGALAQTDPERVFLEIANEPGLDNPQDWYAIESRCMKAMRQAAPKHTIIAGYNMKTGPKEWNGLKALTLFPEIEEKNVIYNFHDYNPMALTHQGASWSKGPNRLLKGVPYPSTPEIIAPLLEKTENPQARAMLKKYGEDRWNRQKMEAEIGVVAEWAKMRGVQVTCNEFGVLRQYAPKESRAAWTRDMRLTLEKYGIGWTIWDGSFGFLEGKGRGGATGVQPDIIEALGLKMP